MPPRVTWLTPACRVWDAKYGEGTHKLVVKKMAMAFAPIRDALGEVEIAKRLGRYLDTIDDPRFINLFNFASTIGQYGQPEATAPVVDSHGRLIEPTDRVARPDRGPGER